jgi:hypothetical protein
MAYEKVTGPLGPERGDILHAVLMALIHNQWAKKGKKPVEFMPEWDRRPQRPEEQMHVLKTLFGGFGGDDS